KSAVRNVGRLMGRSSGTAADERNLSLYFYQHIRFFDEGAPTPDRLSLSLAGIEAARQIGLIQGGALYFLQPRVAGGADQQVVVVGAGCQGDGSAADGE